MRISPSAATRGITRQAPVVRAGPRPAAGKRRSALLGRSEGERLKMGDVEEVALEREHRTAPAAGLPLLLEALRRTRCGCSRREKRFLNLNVRGREPLSKFSNKMSNSLANREFLTIRCIPTPSIDRTTAAVARKSRQFEIPPLA